MKARIRAAAYGALGFLASQLLLVSRSNSGVSWFLNSVAGIWITLGVLAITAIMAQRWDRSSLPTRPLWLAAGSSFAMIGYLFAIGLGNLFPIVIAMGLLMVIPTVVISGYVALLFTERG